MLTVFTVNERAQWHFCLLTASYLVNAGFLLCSSWKSLCLLGGEESSWPSTDKSCWSHIIPWHFRCDTSLLAMLPGASPGRKGIVFLTSSLWLVTLMMTGRHHIVYECSNVTGYYKLPQISEILVSVLITFIFYIIMYNDINYQTHLLSLTLFQLLVLALDYVSVTRTTAGLVLLIDRQTGKDLVT